MQEVRLSPVALRVPRASLPCTWRKTTPVSALMSCRLGRAGRRWPDRLRCPRSRRPSRRAPNREVTPETHNSCPAGPARTCRFIPWQWCLPPRPGPSGTGCRQRPTNGSLAFFATCTAIRSLGARAASSTTVSVTYHHAVTVPTLPPNPAANCAKALPCAGRRVRAQSAARRSKPGRTLVRLPHGQEDPPRRSQVRPGPAGCHTVRCISAALLHRVHSWFAQVACAVVVHFPHCGDD